MNNDIYVIIQGVYSDWTIKGYTASECEAKSICEIYNKKERDRFDSDWYYQKVVLLNEISDESKIYKKFEIRVHEYPKGEYWLSWDFQADQNILLKCPKAPILEEDDEGKFISVFLETDDYKKAEKIAQDFWYAYLAESRENFAEK